MNYRFPETPFKNYRQSSKKYKAKNKIKSKLTRPKYKVYAKRTFSSRISKIQ
jgi:hypothetical protein